MYMKFFGTLTVILFHASEWPCATWALLRSYCAVSGHVGPRSYPGVALHHLRFGHLSTRTPETEVFMKVINLRDIYPHYTQDCFVEVTDEVADLFSEFDHKEAAYRLRTYRHKAYYSLDRNDGIEHEALFVALSPHELYERKVTMQELHAAISRLPDKQAKRIYAHFILGMTKKDIARAEGVHEKVVRVAIERGLRSLEKILKKVL
nr:sigma-70 family RNA polymerase sigma factor [Anaerotruncus colihominis]